MQVVMNKCFLLNLWKKFALIHLAVFEKNANRLTLRHSGP